MKNILNKIYIHPSCYLIIIISLLAANFQKIIFVSLLLFIHECGHFFTAMFFSWPTDKITFYPFGGISKFSHDINCPLKEELIVLLMGPFTQIIFYHLLTKTLNVPIMIASINYQILLFNLLPIYPLDGGRILQCLSCYLFPYRLSFKVIYLISYFFLFLIIIFFLKFPSINLIIIFLLLLYKLSKEKKLITYSLEKFLLERYLHNYHFKKGKITASEKKFQRDYYHIIKNHNWYYNENTYLKKKYENNAIIKK